MSRVLKWYVASSWRNTEQPRIVRLLRDLDQDVYDFKNPPGKTGFAWSQTAAGTRPGDGESLVLALNDPIAVAGFVSDMEALQACDICLLLMPAGISANLELGYAVGAGKTTIVYVGDYPETRAFEPELMWKMADYLVVRDIDLWNTIADLIAPRKAAA